MNISDLNVSAHRSESLKSVNAGQAAQVNPQQIRPEAEAIDATIKRDGVTEAAASEIRRMFTKMRLDYAVIAAVIADMVLKPTRSDSGALLAIAAIVVVVAASVVVGLRSAESPLPDRRPA